VLFGDAQKETAMKTAIPTELLIPIWRVIERIATCRPICKVIRDIDPKLLEELDDVFDLLQRELERDDYSTSDS
jgi:hypothetical protein